MTVYGELLRMTLAGQRGDDERPLGELVALVISRRASLAEPAAPPPDCEWDGGQRSAASIAASTSHARTAAIDQALSYDAALATLCERVGVEHDLAGPSAGPAARRRAEEALSRRLPALAGAFAHAPAPPSRPARSPRGSS